MGFFFLGRQFWQILNIFILIIFFLVFYEVSYWFILCCPGPLYLIVFTYFVILYCNFLFMLFSGAGFFCAIQFDGNNLFLISIFLHFSLCVEFD